MPIRLKVTEQSKLNGPRLLFVPIVKSDAVFLLNSTRLRWLLSQETPLAAPNLPVPSHPRPQA